MVRFDESGATRFYSGDAAVTAATLAAAHESLDKADGAGSDFLGWLRLPRDFDKAEFDRIRTAAQRIREQAEVLIVIGIGGSYLGARAAIELLRSPNHNRLQKPEIYFAGCNLSPSYAAELTALIGGRDFAVNVISKSGTTTEPAIAFRFWRRMLEEKYGAAEARKRIYATTDARRGVLKTLADAEGYESFVVPDNIGGRFSVLTAVGLLPIAVAGADITALMNGAKNAMDALNVRDMSNPAWRYAAVRNSLYGKGYTTEVLACYEPRFRFMAEWWKQLFGESEGKDGKGIFPASVELTADLHSMGQYLQDGRRNLFETVVYFEDAGALLPVPFSEDDADGLNFLAGKELSEINRQAMLGTRLAHIGGGVPCLEISAGAMDETSLGELIYFFELSCGLSGYCLGVNPFDQPGVEAYKKNMFALLGKPGYESLAAELQKALCNAGNN